MVLDDVGRTRGENDFAIWRRLDWDLSGRPKERVPGRSVWRMMSYLGPFWPLIVQDLRADLFARLLRQSPDEAAARGAAFMIRWAIACVMGA